MTDKWDDGYVSDVEYVPGYYAEQSPIHINITCLINGVEPPVKTGDPFTYCELGCGLGETALNIAAGNPKGEIWAFDFMPAHIAGARQLAEKTGITNIHYEEKSFEELALGDIPADMPQFDYITLHGIWTWISKENRDHIVEFIRRHLKPGGAVYNSYNAMPGWTNIVPLRQLMYILGEQMVGQTNQRVKQSLNVIEDLVTQGLRYIPKSFLNGLTNKDPNYLSHEYFNANWDPTFHKDVADVFEKAKLNYIGSSNLLENVDIWCLTKEQIDALNKIPASIRETVRDYFMERTFRRDIFIRGARQIAAKRIRSHIEGIEVILSVPLENIKYDIKIPLGNAKLDEKNYKIIFEMLADKPHTIGNIIKTIENPNDTNPLHMLSMLLASRQIEIVLPNNARRSKADTMKFNKNMITYYISNNATRASFLGSLIGSPRIVGLFQLLVYEALLNNTEKKIDIISDTIWNNLSQRGDYLIDKNRKLETKEQHMALIKPQVETVLKSHFPVWHRLGAI